MRGTNVKRIVLAVGLLWLVAWSIGLARDLTVAWQVLYGAAIVAYLLLGAWSERTRWVPLVLSLLVTAFVAVATTLAVPLVIGGLIVAAAILVPPDVPERVYP